jgi:hypothetical protein
MKSQLAVVLVGQASKSKLQQVENHDVDRVFQS